MTKVSKKHGARFYKTYNGARRRALRIATRMNMKIVKDSQKGFDAHFYDRPGSKTPYFTIRVKNKNFGSSHEPLYILKCDHSLGNAVASQILN